MDTGVLRRLVTLKGKTGIWAAVVAALVWGWLTPATLAWAVESGLCLSCHPKAQPVTLAGLDQAGGDLPAGFVPCPGIRLARKELNLTQQDLARLASALPAYRQRGMDTWRLHRELEALSGRLALVMARPVDSVSQITARLEPIRGQAGEIVFKGLARWDKKRGIGIGAGLIIFAAFLVCLAALVGLWALGEYDARPQPLSRLVDGGLWLRDRGGEAGK